MLEGLSGEFVISTFPTVLGRERIVLALLEPRPRIPRLDELGFGLEVLKLLESLASTREGLFIVAGPGLSGRTTTLHSLASCLASSGRNVLAIEEVWQWQRHGVSLR